jgi:[ribosomal protein S18]-alanine N-acetyltransferase
MAALELRLSTIKDLPLLLKIERLSYPSPWDVHTFLSVMSDEECRNLTAEVDGEVAGFCFSQDMENMVHLLNIAVHPDFRGRGIARALLRDIISFARSLNKSYVFLEVRRTNSPAQTLYSSMGFFHVCVWRRYYTDSGEDACIMAKKIKGKAR